jgi:hypothetical protein
MNIKHSVIAPAHSGKRSMLRRLVAAAATSALMLGVGSASADGASSKGVFHISTFAGMGESYTGKLKVNGDGDFVAKDDGSKLTFIVDVTEPKKKDQPAPIRMKDGRQDHTVGSDSKIGLTWNQQIKLEIDKSGLTFPEPGKEASGNAGGILTMRGKPQKVTVNYKVKEEGGKYKILSASFTFDYTKHTKDGKRACVGPDALPKLQVCVNPTVNISVDPVTIDAKK